MWQGSLAKQWKWERAECNKWDPIVRETFQISHILDNRFHIVYECIHTATIDPVVQCYHCHILHAPQIHRPPGIHLGIGLCAPVSKVHAIAENKTHSYRSL